MREKDEGAVEYFVTLQRFGNMADSLVLRAIKGNARSLNLNSKKIHQVPTAVAKLMSLSTLQLKNNFIATLPCEVQTLINLTELNLGNNVLEEVPLVLTHLRSLRKLHLFGNRIEKIPSEVFEGLSNLKFLNLNHNKVRVIPAEVHRLINLEYLSLNSNQLEDIPFELCFLKNLSEFHVARNRLTLLPQEVCFLTNLTKLFLARNQLNGLPEGIHKLRKLKVIDVAGNQLRMFPSDFQELQLEELYCEENPLLQKELVESEQEEEVLSLKEITARCIFKELRSRSSVVHKAITHYPALKTVLSQGGKCAVCSQGFLGIWLECVKFVNLKKEMKLASLLHTIPVRVLLCSYKCFNKSGHAYYGVAVP
nr:PREDICTED: leucine-rich repeat-containing protein 69 [Lepisosteus oculatus]